MSSEIKKIGIAKFRSKPLSSISLILSHSLYHFCISLCLQVVGHGGYRRRGAAAEALEPWPTIAADAFPGWFFCTASASSCSVGLGAICPLSSIFLFPGLCSSDLWGPWWAASPSLLTDSEAGDPREAPSPSFVSAPVFGSRESEVRLRYMALPSANLQLLFFLHERHWWLDLARSVDLEDDE